jgi:two-component system CheB/CheR fusion protein
MGGIQEDAIGREGDACMAKDKTREKPGKEPGKTGNRKKTKSAVSPELPCAIVGIGASAGGLEALEQFFTHMPANTGMAFVVILHQDPRQKGMLTEILVRYTSMTVVEVSDNIRAEPNTVYVKPSNADIAILQGVLTLLETEPVRGLHLPIDIFFRHLAEDQDGKAVGILLSGTGSDGTLGIRALKEHAGMVMVQDPLSTTFGSMPQSAIATGLVDYVALPPKLPELLVQYVQGLAQMPAVMKTPDRATENELARIFILLRSRSGQDFSQYKRSTIQRRIGRRMSLQQLTSLEDYVRYIQENPAEIDILAKELLIGVTQFFRDPDAWENLKESLSRLIKRTPAGSTLRAWVVGCSTGEEAYTMAVVFQETLDALGRSGEIRYQVFGTDVDRGAIEIARQGVYSANIMVDVSPERLDRFFIREDDTFTIRPEIRETVVFAPHNILTDPPFTHLDALSCRNLLIYLSPELQKKLITLFHYALNPGGILLLGTAESISGHSDLFQAVENKWKIFQRREEAPPFAIHPELPLRFIEPERSSGRVIAGREVPAPNLVQKWLLERFVPSSVIVNENGDILYFQGKTRKYLEPPSGRANLNVYAMAREGLQFALQSAIGAASRDKHEITRDDLFVQTDGSAQRIRLIVQPIPETAEQGQLYLVIFKDQPEPPRPPAPEHPGEVPADARYAALEQEFLHSRQQLQDTVEQMQASQEELRSANEELQSTNEELISSKEELQSLNEELITVNAEYQKKIEELSQITDDMRNVLRSTEIPILFLDNQLRVRRFTEPIRAVINLQSSDLNRPITDLKVNLKDEQFLSDIRRVLDTLQMRVKQVQAEEGRWYEMRILPFRTMENRIDGVVVSFMDITLLKELEASLRDSRNYAENIIATIREPLLVLDEKLKVISANRSFFTIFKVSQEETEGKYLYALGNKQWDIPKLRQLIEDVLPKQTQFEGYVVDHDFPEIGHRTMRLNARKVYADTGAAMILLAIEDVTGQSAGALQQARVKEEHE